MSATETRRHRRPVVIAAAIAGVMLVVVAILVVWAYTQLESNVTTIDPSSGLGDVRPVKENEAMNILAIGSDSRKGSNDFVGGDSPGLADTTLVVHLSADSTWATAVSIPRDSMVQMPDCVKADGTVVHGALRMFNAAYPIGGPVCVQRTVESLTGLPIDHFVVVDFSGFQDMVDAVGGVTVYIPKSISDPQSHIYFDAGCQTLDGRQALNYVRVRHGVGNGSDTDRIKRQQAFLSSLIQKVTSSGVLFNPVDLYKFLDAVTSAVTTDTGLGGIRDLAGMAVRVRAIGLDRIEFTTVPWEAYPPNPNRIQWKQPQADELWEKLRLDQPLTQPEPSASPSGSATGSPSPSKSPSRSPSPSKSPSRSPSPSKSPSRSPSPSTSYDTTKADVTICPTS